MISRKDPRAPQDGAEVVGVIYPCPLDEKSLAAQDEREVGYTRYNIPLEYIKPFGWQRVPPGVTVFQYVPNTELPDDHPSRPRDTGQPAPRAPFPTREYPVPQSYIDVCISGCLEHGEEFARLWIRGMVGWPTAADPHWLNDRLMARRPFLHCKDHNSIDQVLNAEVPESLQQRLLPAEYGLHYLKVLQSGDLPGRRAERARSFLIDYSSYQAGTAEDMRCSVQRAETFLFQCSVRLGGSKSSGLRHGLPCRLRREAGYYRSWCMRIHENNSGNTTIPSLIADSSNARDINGVLYPAPATWDPAIEDEMGMERWVELQPEHFAMLREWHAIPAGAKVYTQVVVDPQSPSYEAPILQSIVDLILAACLEHSKDGDFCKEWVDTTDGWELADGHSYWLNDRKTARRPWVYLGGNYKIFDQILQETTSECVPRSALDLRRLPEEYSTLAKE